MEKNHVEYMKAERNILSKIEHPFVVQLRYSFQTKYKLHLVLDFVNGGHLFFQLYHHGLFREDLACIYAAEIVSAVSHLHANGIMHRDLKPENILLDADGYAMLTDFGLAKQFDESTRSNSLCGTVEYMSPEIVQGRGHDKAADWWSVGILVFKMLTGKLVDEDDEDIVELLCCGVSKQVVARGCIVSKDPSKIINGRQLGKDFWEVIVKEIVQLGFINPSWVGVNMCWKAADVISM